jgi:rhamnosyltransferase
MKLAGTVILFYPPENVFANIATYIHEIEVLYIFDNTPDKIIRIPDEIKYKCSYMHSGENEGIAKKLNDAMNIASNEGFDYLLTMDQDSFFGDGDLKKYKEIISEEIERNNISMFGVRYYELRKNENTNPSVNKLLITSGAVINLKINEIIGGFDENLFIDGVDTDYCLQTFSKGYKTFLVNELSLKHQLGEEKKVMTPLLKSTIRKFHNPTRLYYIVRNHLYLRAKYPTQHQYLNNKIVLNEIKNCLFYAQDFVNNLKAILLAVKHFRKGVFGKIN